MAEVSPCPLKMSTAAFAVRRAAWNLSLAMWTCAAKLKAEAAELTSPWLRAISSVCCAILRASAQDEAVRTWTGRSAKTLTRAWHSARCARSTSASWPEPASRNNLRARCAARRAKSWPVPAASRTSAIISNDRAWPTVFPARSKQPCASRAAARHSSKRISEYKATHAACEAMPSAATSPTARHSSRNAWISLSISAPFPSWEPTSANV
mmetsp:Transcript_5057/g.12404  ORF Transcript_5057/g.12404 Transcript_5057/m.12404 type:complete len:210 (+) Transcript_5057:770-1399(+)